MQEDHFTRINIPFYSFKFVDFDDQNLEQYQKLYFVFPVLFSRF